MKENNMDERELAKHWNQEFERRLREDPAAQPEGPDSDPLVRLLVETDFSQSSRSRVSLRERLLRQAAGQQAQNIRKRDFMIGLRFGFRALLALVVLVLAVLGFDRVYRYTLAPQPTPTLQTTPSPTLPAEASPQPTPPGTPVPAPLVEPAYAANQIFELTWSPDGQWLGFKTLTAAQAAEPGCTEDCGGSRPGSVHFLNPRSGENCQYDLDDPAGLRLSEWYVWRPDSSLLTLDQNRRAAALTGPCSPTPAVQFRGFPEFIDTLLAVDTAQNLFLTTGQSGCFLYDARMGSSYRVERCSADATFSPDGARLGLTLTADRLAYTTEIVDTASGQVTHSFDWTFSAGGLGTLPGPQWLTPDRFLIARTDQGPLLATLGTQPALQPVADDLLNLPGGGTPGQMGTAAPLPESGSEHILISDVDTGQSWLFHSEDETIETLNYPSVRFSPDGQWLFLDRSVLVDNREQPQTWVRPLDPTASEPRQVPWATYSAYAGWAPAMQRVAVALDPQAGAGRPAAMVQAYSLPELAPLQAWQIRANAAAYPLVWSPDLAYLAVIGQANPGEDQSLFLLPAQ